MQTAAAAGVSFVVPIYNKRPFLAGMAAGLAGQRGDFPREFVFVDDGSTDGSGALIAELTAGWPDTRIIAQANSGPSVATNVGIAAARFPLIKPVDADDVLLPDATALLRQSLLRHQDAVLACGRAEGVASHDDAAARRRASAVATSGVSEAVYDALAGLLRNCSLGPSACLFRADAVRQAGGCDERVFTQDYSLFLRLARAGAFVRLDTDVVLYPLAAAGRVNDGGPQVLHDFNLALFYFLSEHRLPRRCRPNRAVRRGIMRAWRWARRREQAGPLNPALLLLLWAYMRFPGLPVDLLRRSCAAFTTSRRVRLMPL
jgi:glycosyltransferase involved in cell wall biosynthesis